MGYAVGLFMQMDLEAEVYDVWQSIKAANISSRMVDGHFRPHISLGVCEDIDPHHFKPVLKKFAAMTPPFAVWLPNVGYFLDDKAVLYIGITVTHHLLDLHQRFQQHFSACATNQNRHYQVGNWVPHITLAVDVAPRNLPRAIEVLNRCVPPLLNRRVEIREIGLVNVHTGETPYYFPLERQPTHDTG
jgi:2'-5' RNA ligase